MRRAKGFPLKRINAVLTTLVLGHMFYIYTTFP